MGARVTCLLLASLGWVGGVVHLPAPWAVAATPASAGSVGEPLTAAGFTGLRQRSGPSAAAGAHLHGDPTAQEQLMLELVNRTRADPAAEAARLGLDLNEGLPPDTLTPDPKPPLGFHPQLIEAARAHSDWMLATDIFDHDGLDGSTPGDRMTAAGYAFTGSWRWGENLAWQGTTGEADLTAFTVEEHEGLFRSPVHRVNLLEANFDEVGIGVRTGEFTADGVDYNAVMATQNFARSSGTPGPLVLGVVFRDQDGDRFYSVGEGLAGVTVMPSRGDSYAVTSASGGFAFPSAGTSGTIVLTISGPGVAAPLTKTVALVATNVKVDFDVGGEVPLAFVPGSAGFDAQGRFRFDLRGAAGTNAQVFFSADLGSWHSLGIYPLNAGGTVTVLDLAGRQTRRFYRAEVLP